jgi:hypothetical protein
MAAMAAMAATMADSVAFSMAMSMEDIDSGLFKVGDMDSMIAEGCRREGLELHRAFCKDEFDVTADLSTEEIYDAKTRQFVLKFYGDEMVDCLGDGVRDMVLKIHAEATPLLHVPMAFEPRFAYLRLEVPNAQCVAYLQQLQAFCNKYQTSGLVQQNEVAAAQKHAKHKTEVKRMKAERARQSAAERTLMKDKLTSLQHNMLSASAAMNTARTLTKRFERLCENVAAQIARFNRPKFVARVAGMWTTVLDVLRLKRVGAMKLMMYRGLDITYGDPSTSAAWWFVNGLKVSEVKTMDDKICNEFRDSGNPIEWQAHDAAYNGMRHQTDRVQTREGAARAAKAATKEFMDRFKANQCDKNGNPTPWKQVKGNKNREPKMKAALFGAALNESRLAPAGRSR